MRMLARRVAVYLLKLAPFIILYWLYEHVRALAVGRELPVHYSAYVLFEARLFGQPLSLWFAAHRSIVLDVIAGIVYALHPVYFIVFAVVVLLKNERLYGELVAAFTVSSAVAVTAYALHPTEPPWMVYPGIARPPNLILELVELVAGVRIDPNPYAAMPSMHVCMAVIFAWCAWRMTQKRVYRLAAASWPLLMSFATLYTVNHYLADILAGGTLGLVSCWLAGRLAKLTSNPRIAAVVQRLSPRPRQA